MVEQMLIKSWCFSYAISGAQSDQEHGIVHGTLLVGMSMRAVAQLCVP